MPAGALVTEPVPVPARVTVSARWAMAAKVAVTLRAALMVTVQVVAVPVQEPLEPVKLEVGDGAAVRVTLVPVAKLAEQVVPQLTPAGALVTVPVPVPARVTVRVRTAVKVAVAAWAWLMV